MRKRSPATSLLAAALVIGAALLVVLRCDPVLAAEPEDTEPPETRPVDAEAASVPPVTVRAVRPVDGSPSAFVSVVRIEDDRRPGDSVGDLLERLPGATIRDLGGPGQRTTLSLRGSSGDQVSVYLDGIRLTPPAGGGFDFSLISPHVLSRIDVVRGGDSARFGSGAIGGTVRMWTPRPVPGEAATARAFASYGSFVTFRAGGSASGSLGPLAVLVTGGFEHSDGRFPYVDDNGRRRSRENSGVERGELLLRSRWVAGPGVVLDALVDLFADARGIEGPSECPSLTAEQGDARGLAGLALEADGLALDTDRLRVSVAARADRFRFADETPCFGPRAPVGATTLVGSANAAYEVAIRAHELRAVVALDVEHLAGSSLKESVSRVTSDLIASASLRFGDGRLVVTPAFRLALVTRAPPVPVPRLGVRWRPLGRPPLWLQANAGRGFRYPSFHELHLAVDGIAGNVELKPEDAWDIEAGVLWQGKRLRLELSGFASIISNTILFVPRSGSVIQAENFTGVVAVGGELSADVAIGFGIGVRGDLSIARARLRDDPGRRLPGRPDWSGGVHVAWSIPRSPLTIWAGADGRTGMTLDRLGNLVEEGRVLVSAGASLVIARGVVLRVEARNLFDKRDAVDSLQLPLPGRAVFAELRWASKE